MRQSTEYKDNPENGGGFFAYHTREKKVTTKIHKELKQRNSEKTKNSVKNGQSI